jgi:polyisoprenoid-binding protein YceI
MIFFSLSGYAQASQAWQVIAQKSSVEFLVHTTLHEVNGRARQLYGSFEQRKNLIKGSINVGVVGLTTNNEARDRNMYKMFDASRYTQVHFSFNNVNIDDVLKRKEGHIIFTGEMTIHHISCPLTVLTRCRMFGKSLACEGKLLVSLKDYDLKPPSILGIIRVNDEVLAQFNIMFLKGNANENI